jgi:hypothetical protein
MVKKIVSLSISCMLLSGSTALAAKIDFTPSLTIDQMYNSNISNTERNEIGDFILIAEPGVTFSLKMPETTLNLRSSVSFDTYYKYTDRNRYTSAVSLGLGSDPPITLTKRLSIAPRAHYVRANNSFHRNQLEPTGDPLVPTAIVSESGVQTNQRYGGGLAMSYLLTPSWNISLGGGYSKQEFLDNAVVNFDSRVVSGDTSISYQFHPKFSMGLFANTSYNTFENADYSRIYAGGLLATYQSPSAYNVVARAGASRAQEHRGGIPERITWSPYGLLSIGYSSVSFLANLAGSINQSGGGSLGFTTETESVTFNLSDQLATRWWADLSGNYQRSKSMDPESSQSLKSATGTAGIRYQPWEWATFHLSGSVYEQWSHYTNVPDMKRYTGLLGITLGYTYNLMGAPGVVAPSSPQ